MLSHIGARSMEGSISESLGLINSPPKPQSPVPRLLDPGDLAVATVLDGRSGVRDWAYPRKDGG